jgi:hypothetical protein
VGAPLAGTILFFATGCAPYRGETGKLHGGTYKDEVVQRLGPPFKTSDKNLIYYENGSDTFLDITLDGGRVCGWTIFRVPADWPEMKGDEYLLIKGHSNFDGKDDGMDCR